MKEVFDIIRKNVLLKDISGEDFDCLIRTYNISLCYFNKNQTIRPPEIEVTEIGIVVKGFAYTTKNDIFGNRVILAEIAPGSSFGESLLFTGEKNSPVSIVSAEDNTAILFLPLKKILQNCPCGSRLYVQLLENIARRLAEKNVLLQMKNDILSKKTTREKLLLYFEYESKTANSKTFKIHFSREELADFLSLNSSALSRELGKMRDEGLLLFERNKFTLRQD